MTIPIVPTGFVPFFSIRMRHLQCSFCTKYCLLFSLVGISVVTLSKPINEAPKKTTTFKNDK